MASNPISILYVSVSVIATLTAPPVLAQQSDPFVKF